MFSEIQEANLWLITTICTTDFTWLFNNTCHGQTISYQECCLLVWDGWGRYESAFGMDGVGMKSEFGMDGVGMKSEFGMDGVGMKSEFGMDGVGMNLSLGWMGSA